MVRGRVSARPHVRGLASGAMSLLYLEASVRFIATLLLWIAGHDPGRVEPLTWPEVLSNVDHAANHGDPDAARMIFTDYFADRPEWAVRTVACESGGDPWAVNSAGPYHGPWQVLNGALGDVRWNTEQARSIFDRQGPGAWPHCGR